MENLNELEILYLNAKVKYYDGFPIMSNSAFDILEKRLKTLNSKVVEQVGAKRKDFDFPHPNKMKSLSKIQLEAVSDNEINYQWEEFNKWFIKRYSVIGKNSKILEYSPKFDGSAINIIYRNGILESVLTRGDGFTGKQLIDRFSNILPSNIQLNGVLEIRCEAVMKLSTFNLKYFNKYENPRNLVAGILGRDEYVKEMVADINLLPVRILHNSKDLSISSLGILNHEPFDNSLYKTFEFSKVNYINVINDMINLRKDFEYPLDGIVFSFPYQYREILGENDHDPDWAIAVKFIPDEVISTVIDIEWNIGKTGEFTPVILIEPVNLAGTTVKRVSGYNAGYIVNNNIQIGTIVSVQKAGDIVPEVKKIIYTPENI